MTRRIIAKCFDDEYSFTIEKQESNRFLILDEVLGKINAEVKYLDELRAEVVIDGKKYVVVIDEDKNIAYVNGVPTKITVLEFLETKATNYELISNNQRNNREENPGEIKAPLSGKIVSVKVSVGEKVSRGETLLIMESMKMLNKIKSPYDGEVKNIFVKDGVSVKKNQLLLKIEPKNTS